MLLPDDLYIELLKKDVKRRNREYEYKGSSMVPLFKPDQKIFLSQPRTIKVGDVVCYLRNNELIGHRVVKIDNNKIITKGDNLLEFDKPIPRKRIIGKITTLNRDVDSGFNEVIGRLIAIYSFHEGKLYALLTGNAFYKFLGKIKFQYISKTPYLTIAFKTLSKLLIFPFLIGSSSNMLVMYKDNAKQSIKNFYNQPSQVEFYRKLMKRGLTDGEKHVINKYFKKKGLILDIGCGAGREAFALAKKGFRVIGVDFIPEQVKFARKYAKQHKIKNVQFYCKDAESLDQPNQYFDYIVLPTLVIRYIKGRESRIRLLKRCKDMLKNEGVLFFTTSDRKKGLKNKVYWSLKEAVHYFKKFTGMVDYGEIGDYWRKYKNDEKNSFEKVFIHFYTTEEAKTDLEKTGLRLVEHVVDENVGEFLGEKKKYTHHFFVCKKQLLK